MEANKTEIVEFAIRNPQFFKKILIYLFENLDLELFEKYAIEQNDKKLLEFRRKEIKTGGTYPGGTYWNYCNANYQRYIEKNKNATKFRVLYEWSYSQLPYASNFLKEGIYCEEIKKHTPINNLIWNEELIQTYKEYWDWKRLSCHPNILWSESLIQAFEDDWDWDYLSKNFSLKLTKELLDKYQHKWNWRAITRNPSIPWTDNLIEKYKKKWNLGWLTLKINWNERLISTYYHNLNWRTLSARQSIHWSPEILFKFKNELFWYHIVQNHAIPWDLKLIEQSKEFWSWERQIKMNGRHTKNRQSVLMKHVVAHLDTDLVRHILQLMALK